jgi:transposase
MTKEKNVMTGIDCSMDKHQYQVSTKEEVLMKGVIKNSKKSAKDFVKKLQKVSKTEEVIIGMESTNTYHLCLKNYLVGRGYEVIVINPLKTSAYNKIDDFGNKTDPIDANCKIKVKIDYHQS